MPVAPHPDRASGVLLHPTSLPGPHGIGDFGAGALGWLDLLAAGRQQLWQIMPLGPPGYGESPYNARSAFAINPLLIALDQLVDHGLLERADLEGAPEWSANRVDFGAVAAYKLPLLRLAFDRSQDSEWVHHHQNWVRVKSEYLAFKPEAASWLEDFALFMALREANGGRAWNTWDAPLIRRDPAALDGARREFADQIEFQRFLQFYADCQWDTVRAQANGRGIRIIGDIPIFVSHDSADAWAHQDLFHLDPDGNPTVVAGVPPDYFSATGQRWGNPLYRWDRLAARGYDWWIERFRAVLRQVDVIRIDHFRGFESYWEVPADEQTAENGRWVPGPGLALFRAVADALGPLPVIVEDLGLITPQVDALREALGYPGMSVLQFGFGGGPTNPYLPHNHQRNSVVYTGTHDNDTTEGWFAALSEPDRAAVIRYLGAAPESISRKLMRAALGSVAQTSIIPLQDVLGLGAEARMNLPGWATGNWAWRAAPEQIDPQHATWLAEMTEVYGRVPVAAEAEAGAAGADADDAPEQ